MRVAATVASDDHGISVLRPLGGAPMLVWAVRCLLKAGVDSPVLLDGPAAADDVLRACGDLPVRLRSSREDSGADGDVHILHDARRPLTPPALVAAVLDAVQAGWDAVVPALALTDTVKLVDADGLVRGSPDRERLRVVQAPRAWRSGTDAAHAHLVPGDPLAFAVHTEWDLELAELLR